VITFLRGKLEEKQPGRAVIDVNGVGYEVFIPLSTYDKLPSAGETCKILTYDHVREDIHNLFGFATEAEKGTFLLLIGVSGIGPKLALCVLSGLPPNELKGAVINGDIERIKSVPGVGKKTAERIVVELKHKMSDADILEAMTGEKGESDGRAADAVMALTSLGYKPADARKMVAEILREDKKGSLTIQDIVRKILKGRT